MARVALLANEQAPAEVRDLFTRIEGNKARVINLYRAIAHSPATTPAFIKLGNVLLRKAKLSPLLRELAILRIAKITRSEYEWDQHVSIAREAGLSQEQIDRLHDWKNAPCYSDAERAVLQYTDEVTRDVTVTDDTFEKLRNYLDETGIVELTVSIGYWNMIARVLVALEVDIDERAVDSTTGLIGDQS